MRLLLSIGREGPLWSLWIRKTAIGQPEYVNEHSGAQFWRSTRARFSYRFEGDVCGAPGACEALCSLNV